MAKTNFVKKLSIKTMGAIPEKYRDMANGESIAIAQIIGRADGVETGVSTYGDWKALVGVFKGINLGTGEIFRASKAFLPDIAVDMIESMINEVGEGGAVEFAVEIGIVREVKLNAQNAETGIGYAYTVSPMLEADKATDPLASLEARLPALGLLATPQAEIPYVESVPAPGKSDKKVRK